MQLLSQQIGYAGNGILEKKFTGHFEFAKRYAIIGAIKSLAIKFELKVHILLKGLRKRLRESEFICETQ